MRFLNAFLTAVLAVCLTASPALAAYTGTVTPVSKGGTGATTLDGAGIVTKTGTQTLSGDKTFSGTTTLGTTNVTTFVLSGTLTANGTATFNKTAQASTAETIATLGVSGLAGQLIAENGTSNDSFFVPRWRGLGMSTNTALELVAQGETDSGSNGLLALYTRISTNTAVSTRPYLTLNSGPNQVLSFLPLNSGANLAASWGAQSGAAPAITGATGSTRSIGTRLILSKNDSASEGDYSLGYSAGKMWAQLANTSANLEVYGAATLAHTLKGSGLADHVGTVRSQGATTPGSGAGVEVRYGGAAAGVGDIIAYDRGAGAYKDFRINGLTVQVRANDTLALTASPTALTAALPMGFKSYTVATLPAATTAGQMIYVSDESGGAVMAFSDGTNWRRVTDRAIVS